MSCGVIPWFLVACGWSSRRKPQYGYWQGPSGARTWSGCTSGVPYRFAPLIGLYVATCVRAHGREVRGSLRQMCHFLGVSWSMRDARKRLQQFARCSYALPGPGGAYGLPAKIADDFEISTGGTFRLVVTDELLAAVEQGALIDMGRVRALNRSMSALGLCLWLTWAMHRGESRARIPLFAEQGPYTMLPSSAARSSTRQNLAIWMARIHADWPGCPFRLVAGTDALMLDDAARAAEQSTATRATQHAVRATQQAAMPARAAEQATAAKHAPMVTKPGAAGHRRAERGQSIARAIDKTGWASLRPSPRARAARSSPGAAQARGQATSPLRVYGTRPNPGSAITDRTKQGTIGPLERMPSRCSNRALVNQVGSLGS